MKRWAILVVGVYVLMLVVLSVPALLFLAGFDFDEIPRAFSLLPFWIWIAVLVLGEALLLLVPISLTQRRLKPRRRLLIPIITTTFFLWLLAICAGSCLSMAIWGEKGLEPGPSEESALWMAITATLGLWLFWMLVFLRYRRTTAPSALTARLMRWLLGGSILELLVAVPTHIVVRQRNECCSPAITGVGIYTGIAVMLMSFGPGVFVLYVDRYGKVSRPTTRCRKCGYDLRATPDRCPECGTERRRAPG